MVAEGEFLARQTTLSSPLPRVKQVITVNGTCVGHTYMHTLLLHCLLCLHTFENLIYYNKEGL